MKTIVTGGSGFIGRHLLRHLAELGHEVVNIDIAPQSAELGATWRNVSILDQAALVRVFGDFQPRYCVHLAAVATMEALSLDELVANTVGTANVISACAQCSTVERLVVTSTQHVRRPGSPPPLRDDDYVPYTYYGESKAIAEKLTRANGGSLCWTIVRPTTVWGPFQLLLANGLWRTMARGWYLHPAPDNVVRSYGYVKNVVWQMGRILSVEAGKVRGRTFYVADGNFRQSEWIRDLSWAITGKAVRSMPVGVISVMAECGELLRRIGVRFPMYRERFFNLTTSNIVPIDETLRVLGTGPVSHADGIRETAEWLREYYLRK